MSNRATGKMPNDDDDANDGGVQSRPLCPSSPCTEGAHLIGVIQKDGRVGHFPQAFKVDAAFIDTAKLGRAPEKRFRFASPCLETGCGQWTGNRCGVIDKVMQELDTLNERAFMPSAPPACCIRDRCRWIRQLGDAACGACPEVVTDTLATFS